MSTQVTLLRSKSNPLAKKWNTDGDIVPVANATWFEARELSCDSLTKIQHVLTAIEQRSHVALVKEAIAPGANHKRLRRKCVAGVDKYTSEHYPAGLVVVPKSWIVVDIENLDRPISIDYRDGTALASHARSALPAEFNRAACVWQLSGSAGHPSRRDDVRLHLFFVLDTAVVPAVWKPFFRDLKFVDPSAFDRCKLIFTAAPILCGQSDPIRHRVGLLQGEAAAIVPASVKRQSAGLAKGVSSGAPPVPHVAPGPMPQAAEAFVEILARSNILRSQHATYLNDRARRLAFAKTVYEAFGIADPGTLADAFRRVCVGADDPHGEHDARQAVAWALDASFSGRPYSTRKLLCDASMALHKSGDKAMAKCAAGLAMHFWKIETGAGDREKGRPNV